MIQTRDQLYAFLKQDAKAIGRTKISAPLFGDEMWKFQLTMRKLDYYHHKKKEHFLYLPLYAFFRMRYHKLSVKLGLSIPFDVCGKGLSIPHYGCVVVHSAARIGENCRILDGVNIGATNGSPRAPRIGNNVFIGSGAKVLGDIAIADNVAIGANAVVIKSITEPGTTWAGVPARKVSDHSSLSHLHSALNEAPEC